jgi:oxalate decarboxylase/phosphoglucose isomerase-like protein (cupin superfamily)
MDNAAFTIVDCTLIELPRIHNRAGNITAVQNGIELPFNVQRIYYLYDIPAGETRGAHGHKNLEQLIIAASGSFDITLDDGRSKKTVQLNKPYVALHVRPGIWRDITNFSSGAICLVLASHLYDELDYIRDYEVFKQFKKI